MRKTDSLTKPSQVVVQDRVVDLKPPSEGLSSIDHAAKLSASLDNCDEQSGNRNDHQPAVGCSGDQAPNSDKDLGTESACTAIHDLSLDS